MVGIYIIPQNRRLTSCVSYKHSVEKEQAFNNGPRRPKGRSEQRKRVLEGIEGMEEGRKSGIGANHRQGPLRVGQPRWGDKSHREHTFSNFSKVLEIQRTTRILLYRSVREDGSVDFQWG